MRGIRARVKKIRKRKKNSRIIRIIKKIFLKRWFKKVKRKEIIIIYNLYGQSNKGITFR
jgi:hypothetical protein